MTRIMVRKATREGGDNLYIFFKEGCINYPLFILDSYEAGYLLKEIVNQTDSGFKITDDGEVVHL